MSTLSCEAISNVEEVVLALVVCQFSRILLSKKCGDALKSLLSYSAECFTVGVPLRRALEDKLMEQTSLYITSFSGRLTTYDYLSLSGIRTRQYTYLVDVMGCVEFDKQKSDVEYFWINAEDVSSAKVKVSELTKSLLEEAFVRCKGAEKLKLST